MKILPVSCFLPEELLGGVASKEEKIIKCPRGRELSGFAGFVPEKKRGTAAGVKSPGERQFAKSEISVVQATDRYKKETGIVYAGEGNWLSNMQES